MSVVSGAVEVPSMSILEPFALTQVGVQSEAVRAKWNSRAGDAESAIGDRSFECELSIFGHTRLDGHI